LTTPFEELPIHLFTVNPPRKRPLPLQYRSESGYLHDQVTVNFCAGDTPEKLLLALIDPAPVAAVTGIVTTVEKAPLGSAVTLG
jgi:hypothetical protein